MNACMHAPRFLPEENRETDIEVDRAPRVTSFK